MELPLEIIYSGIIVPIFIWIWRTSKKIDLLEQKISHSPTKEDINKLTLSIRDLRHSIELIKVKNTRNNNKIRM